MPVDVGNARLSYLSSGSTCTGRAVQVWSPKWTVDIVSHSQFHELRCIRTAPAHCFPPSAPPNSVEVVRITSPKLWSSPRSEKDGFGVDRPNRDGVSDLLVLIDVDPAVRSTRWMWRDRRCAIAWWTFCWRRTIYWRHSSFYTSFWRTGGMRKQSGSRSSSPISLGSLPIRFRGLTLSEVILTSIIDNMWLQHRFYLSK